MFPRALKTVATTISQRVLRDSASFQSSIFISSDRWCLTMLKNAEKEPQKKSSTRQRKSIEQEEVPTFFCFFFVLGQMAVVIFFVQGKQASFFSRTAFFVSFDSQLKTLDGSLQSTSARSATQVGRFAGTDHKK